MGVTAVAATGRTDSASAGQASRARIDHVHYFRGFAILLIIATHVLSVFDWRDNRELERLLKYAVANGTILFLFISGYLFDHLSRDFEVREFWGKKLRFVALPYFIVSVPALLIFTMVMRREELRDGFYDQSRWAQALEFLVTGKHLAPFWFIPTILAFYLAAPLIRATFRADRAFLVLPLLFLLPAWFPRADNPLLNVPHFLPVWVMGMAASRFRGPVERIARIAWPLFGLAALGLGHAEMLYTKGTHSYLGYMQKSVLILFVFSVFVVLGRRPERWLAAVATSSFGLFFVHSYVITAGKMALQRVLGHQPPGTLWGVLLAAAMASVVSYAIVQLLRRVLRSHSRHVIGV